jgi:glycosyltransferase involved in cell wall biosynthesis
VVVNGELEALLTELGIAPHRVERIPNGVDVKKFEPGGPGSKAAARAALELPQDRTLALYSGRLERVKGVDILLDAWAQVPDKLRDTALLLVVGDGQEREALERSAVNQGLSTTVAFLGQQQDVLGFYHASDIFVLPSRAEGMSNSLLEAMSCGMPVIASEVGGASDVVAAPRTGLLFPPEDVDALSDCIAKYLSTPNMWGPIGKAARSQVSAQAGLEEVVTRYEELYRRLLEGDQ